MLINVRGVVSRRSNVFPQLKIMWIDCSACGAAFGPFTHNQKQDFRCMSHTIHIPIIHIPSAPHPPLLLRPKRCPQCQSKGGFTVNAERTIYRNYQKITLQEVPGTVRPLTSTPEFPF